MSRRFKERRACWQCQADFLATLRDMVFCSSECGNAWRASRPAAPIARSIDRQGYVIVGGQYEHRLVAEMVLGRRLRSDEDVHHLNGIRHDNRPENLSVLPHGAHATHHHEARLLNDLATKRQRSAKCASGPRGTVEGSLSSNLLPDKELSSNATCIL